MIFDWDDANREHIARHDVSPEEAEQVLRNKPLVEAIRERSAERRAVLLGGTDRGRRLTVVITGRKRGIRVVTAYSMNSRQKTLYTLERK